MVKEFPQYDVTTVKLFSTIPSLMMIVCSLMSGKLIQIFPIKKIVIGCACIMFAAGFGTYFVFNLPGYPCYEGYLRHGVRNGFPAGQRDHSAVV